MINNEAVEAAALALRYRLEGVPRQAPMEGAERSQFEQDARAALEAAAPHMRFDLQCMALIDEME